MAYRPSSGLYDVTEEDLGPPVMVGAGASKNVHSYRAPPKRNWDELGDLITRLGAINLKAKMPPSFKETRQRMTAENPSTTYPGGRSATALSVAPLDIVFIPRHGASPAGKKVNIHAFSSFSGLNYAKYLTAEGTPNLSKLERDFNFAGVALSPYVLDSTTQNVSGYAVQATGTSTVLNTGKEEIFPADLVIWSAPKPNVYPLRAQPGQPHNKIYPVLEPLSPLAIQDQLGLAYDTMMNKSFGGAYNLSFSLLNPNTCDKNKLTSEQELALGLKMDKLNTTVRGIETLAVRGVIKVLTPRKKILDDLGSILVQQMLQDVGEGRTQLANYPQEAQNLYNRLMSPNASATNVAAGQGILYHDQTDSGVETVSNMETMAYPFFKDGYQYPPERRILESEETTQEMLWLAARLGLVANNMYLNEVWQKDVIDSVMVPFVASETLARTHMLDGPPNLGMKKVLSATEILIQQYRRVSLYAPRIGIDSLSAAIFSVTDRIVGQAISHSKPSTKLDLLIGFSNAVRM
jgi:hypothetical protein